MRFETDLFQNALNRTMDNRMRKKTMEEELAQKRLLMREQASYENQSLSPEEKLFRLSQQKPDEFREYMQVKNTITPYQQAMLGIQRGQLGLQSQRIGVENTPDKQRLVQFLVGQGIAPDEALDRVGLKKPPPSKEEEMQMLLRSLDKIPAEGASR